MKSSFVLLIGSTTEHHSTDVCTLLGLVPHTTANLNSRSDHCCGVFLSLNRACSPITFHLSERFVQSGISPSHTLDLIRLRRRSVASLKHLLPHHYHFRTPPSRPRHLVPISLAFDSGVRRMSNYSKHKEIVTAVYDKFEKAKASGDLLFFPSEVSTHRDSGVEAS